MTGVIAEAMPAELRDALLRAGNGELAWPLARAVDAARWLAVQGIGIVGGELYERLPEMHWGTFVDEWSTTPPWSGDEPWPAYVERALQQARRAIEMWARLPGADFKVCLIGRSQYDVQIMLRRGATAR